MQTEPTQQKFNALFQMLIELAMGDLSFRIPTNTNPLETTLNHFATQLQDEIKATNNSSYYFSYHGLVHDIIIIDDACKIKGFNSNLATKLSYSNQKLMGLEIKHIIAQNSHHFFYDLKLLKNKSNTIYNILFLTFNKQLIPASCLISCLYGTTDLIITTITLNVNHRVTLQPIVETNHNNPSEIEIGKKIYNYIMENLGKPLPHMKQLCRIVGTNEFTLKESFKKQYKTSIYQFYNDERLRRAHLLIQQTTLPLKEVAINSGFNDYANFSKAFKKKYNYTPIQLVRKL